MPTLSDVIQAKQVLSARLLSAGHRHGVVRRGFTRSVRAAVASAAGNVHAVGVGRKPSASGSGELCVRMYVVQKLADSLLPPRDRIPATFEGIPTDIVQAPPAFLSGGARRVTAAKAAPASEVAPPPRAAAAGTCTDNRWSTQRPVVAGISAAHVDVTAGTIGYFCRSVRHGDDPTQVYLLSNNHILADLNEAQAGDAIYQPSPADGGLAQDAVATFTRAHPLVLDGQTPNEVDAAIAALTPGIAHTATICGIGAVTGVADAAEDMVVCKHGRTTGYTEGVVTDIALDVLVGMDHNDPSVEALFQNQIRIGTVAGFPAVGLGGDSGSLVVAKEGRQAVGLYFANPPDGSYGLANPIRRVLDLLEVQF